jgi:hypothetical protein
MLFMVIENFKGGDPAPIDERFRAQGRMLPEGLIYHASWMELNGARCFQIMEGARREMLQEWTARWSDLIDFEIVPVLNSADFWDTRLKSASPMESPSLPPLE